MILRFYNCEAFEDGSGANRKSLPPTALRDPQVLPLYTQSWAPATWKVAALPLLGKKSSGAAAYCYSNEKVAQLPLPLLACKTAAAAATLKK